MDLFGLEHRFDLLIEAWPTVMQKESETLSLEGKALLQRRIQQTGMDATGTPLRPYTKEYERFKRGASGRKPKTRKGRAARAAKPATASKPVGKFSGHVDLTLTGQMWRNIGIVEERRSGGFYETVLGGRTDLTKKKMKGNAKRRPRWERLSARETEILGGISKDRVTKVISEFFL